MSALGNTLLVVVDLVVLCGLVLWLHRLSPRYGLAPLMLCLAAIVTILHTLGPVGVFVEALPGIHVIIVSVALVPAALLGMLAIYVVQGTAAARITLFGILGVSILALGLHLLQSGHLAMPGGGNIAGLPADHRSLTRSPSITVGSLAAFALSLTAIVVVYQTVINFLPRTPAWITPGLALLAALWTDTLVFRLVGLGWMGFMDGVGGTLAQKSAAGLVVWPLAAWYLVRVAPRMPGYVADRDRGALDLLLGTYGRQAQVLSTVEAARRLTEDELRRAETWIATIVSNAPIVFFALDREGRFTLSEGQGLVTLGLEPGQVVGQSAFDLYPEAGDEIRRALGGEVVKATVRVGQLVWETAYTPIVDETGEVSGVTGVAHDLTERVAAEEALRESEVRFRSTFEQAAVGIAHVDIDGRLLRVNQRYAEMLGYERADLLNVSYESLTHPEDRAATAERLERLLAGELESFSIERRYVRQDGGSVWGNLTAALLRDEAGQPAYFVFVIEDITRRRQTEDQLRQSQKMEVVGQLTGGVAHDYNNLMTVIMGGLELARADVGEGHRAVSALDAAIDATRRGASLTQRLLAFARRQTLRPTVVDLGALLTEMQDLLTASLREAIEVRSSVAADLWTLRADRPQMENAILNLVLNARDAMPRGGHLEIRASNAVLDDGETPAEGAPAGEYVLLEVSDDGAGMPSEILEHAFEPFFTTKEVGKGSGLGLSMVYGFVSQSGGHISIESEQGKGTTVRLYMPRAEGAPSNQAHPVASVAEGLDGDAVILVVEDDPDVRRLVVRLIDRLGYETLEAEEAHAALAILDVRPDVDLLFTDLVLPGGTTGAELAREARRRRPSLRVLYSSGYSRDVLAGEGRLDDEVALVEKPFEKSTLALALRGALHG
jgi:PAS domain S-box-containing protein